MVMFNMTLKVGHRHLSISCFHHHNVYGYEKSAAEPTIYSAAGMTGGRRDREIIIYLLVVHHKHKENHKKDSLKVYPHNSYGASKHLSPSIHCLRSPFYAHCGCQCTYITTTEQAFVPGHLSRLPLGPGQ